MSIRKVAAILTIAALTFGACSSSATSAPGGASGGCKVGVAWATFQEERYGLRDEPAIRAALAAGGATYIGNSALNKADIQTANVESLIAAGIKVLVLNSTDPKAMLPSVKKAVDAGIAVIAYDRELESAKALFMTHDNVEVGRMIAEAVTKAQPTGNYAIILGDKTQTNPVFLRTGMAKVLDPLIASGAIKIVGEQNTPNWAADAAQTEMEQMLTAANNDIQAVLSENDNMATGAVAALKAQGLELKVKIGAQDGDKAALNRVALGTQVVSVWKNSADLGTAAGKAALELCKNPDISKVTGAKAVKTSGGLDGYGVNLNPVPITQDNLQVVLDAKWITVAELCKDVKPASVKGCP